MTTTSRLNLAIILETSSYDGDYYWTIERVTKVPGGGSYSEEVASGFATTAWGRRRQVARVVKRIMRKAGSA